MLVARSRSLVSRALPWLISLYAAASFIHFAHNAQYLADYPNLPAAWSRAEVYIAWCGLSALGALGYVLYRRGNLRAGLPTLALYSLAGLGGLLHYTRAPFSHHTAAMNRTIWAEVAAAALLLVDLACISAAGLPEVGADRKG
jgi:hypothetical protein